MKLLSNTPAALVVLLLIPLAVMGAPPQIWFCPLDSHFRSFAGYAGSPEYMSLFTPEAPWKTAAAHTNVFKVYSTWVDPASDEDLKVQFADLKRRGIALALEAGAMTGTEACGQGIEGQGGDSLLKIARKIQRDGGVLRYLAMDEPIYYWTLFAGKNACRYTVDQMVANAAVTLRAFHAEFPDVLIGDIEPFPVAATEWLAQYRAGIQAFQKALAFPLRFFHADVAWSAPTHLSDLAALRKMLAAEHLPLGIIYNGTGSAGDQADPRWVEAAKRHMVSVEMAQGSPEMVIFQSWDPYPKKLLPDSDPGSFTWLINSYFRRRTTLRGDLRDSTFRGMLTTDDGHPIANAPITLTLSPTAGDGLPSEYSIDGNVPAGAQTIVFGARINQECNCDGTADLLLSGFRLEAGGAGVVHRDFLGQLAGWSVSSGFAKMEGTALHIALKRGESFLLNSEPISFTAAVPFTLRVQAQVAPRSVGSGYFALIFLGASGEVGRVLIPLAPATVTLGTATTDSSGRFRLRLPAKRPEAFQVEATYAGDKENWPALAHRSMARKAPR